MKKILGLTDNEIRLNLEQQFIERAVAAELEGASEIVSNSTFFDNIIKLYGDEAMGVEDIGGAEGEGGEGGAGGGGGAVETFSSNRYR